MASYGKNWNVRFSQIRSVIFNLRFLSHLLISKKEVLALQMTIASTPSDQQRKKIEQLIAKVITFCTHISQKHCEKKTNSWSLWTILYRCTYKINMLNPQVFIPWTWFCLKNVNIINPHEHKWIYSIVHLQLMCLYVIFASHCGWCEWSHHVHRLWLSFSKYLNHVNSEHGHLLHVLAWKNNDCHDD